MSDYYWQIKMAHVGLVLCSGSLFAVRGIAVLAGQQWANAKPVKYLSYGIDTSLLAAALLLLGILHLNPFTTAWLGVKLSLLLLYIVLGVFALRRAKSRKGRLIMYLAALSVFGFMYSVARAHHPLGIFHYWMS